MSGIPGDCAQVMIPQSLKILFLSFIKQKLTGKSNLQTSCSNFNRIIRTQQQGQKIHSLIEIQLDKSLWVWMLHCK